MAPTVVPAPKVRSPHFRLAALWGSMSALALLMAFPYILAIGPELPDVGMPLWVLAVLQSLQMLVFATLLAWVGLKAGSSLGLGAPLTRAWLSGELTHKTQRAFGKVLLIGIMGGVAILALSLVIDPFLPPPKEEFKDPGPWLGFLASFYGGIGEEVQLRLFAVSGIAWLFASATKQREQPRASIMLAVVVAAFLFGVGHLPAAAGIWGLTPMVVFRTLLLNMLLGLPFGFIYARWGLEHAAASHFAADLILHVVAPLLAMLTLVA